MLEYTWQPRKTLISPDSVVTIKDLNQNVVTPPQAPVIAGRLVTIYVAKEGRYFVSIKSQTTTTTHRVDVNDTSNDTGPGITTPLEDPQRPGTFKIGDDRLLGETALNAAFVPQSVIDTSQSAHATQITTTSGSNKNGMRIVNAANSYGLKIDQTGAGGTHDAVNIAANFTGAHTPFSVNSNNTTLSTVKILNPAAQTGGAVIVGIGSSPTRTAQIIQADNSGSGASFLATQQPGSTGAGLQIQYQAGETSATYNSRAVWVQARHTGGDTVFIENASNVAQTSGSLVTIVQPNTGTTVPCLTLSPFGTGPGLKINASGASILAQIGNNFSVDSNGAIRAPQWVNSTTFNNARVQVPTTGTIIDRNVNDANPVLTVQNNHASFAGNIQEWRNSSGTAVAKIRPNGCITTLTSTTVARPTASSAGIGAQYYDTTLSKPVWSDGTTWRDAMGNVV